MRPSGIMAEARGRDPVGIVEDGRHSATPGPRVGFWFRCHSARGQPTIPPPRTDMPLKDRRPTRRSDLAATGTGRWVD